MKYVLVTGYPEINEIAQMEVISEDGTTVICQNSNYPKNISSSSAVVTDGTTIVVCGGYDGKFFPKFSAAASGWAGCALAHPEFGSSVNPITTRGADYAQRITASPPGFENLAAALLLVIWPCPIIRQDRV